jgi:phosphatidate cytidylyltransferase
MLGWRIFLGVVFGIALAALCWLDANARTPGTWLFPVALAITLLGTDELLRMLATRSARPVDWAVQTGNAVLVASNWLPVVWPSAAADHWIWPMLALAASIILVLSVEVVRYREPGGQSERLAASALAFGYIGVLLSFAIQLRFVGPEGAWGMAALVSLVMVVKLSDIGAYTVGRLIGRHKLAPRLSPGKTIEGACGGLAFAAFGSWLALVILWPRLSGTSAPRVDAWQWLGFALTVTAAGMIGDLAESLLKRDLGRKDSSDWMPGFGGVLDLVDSVLVAAPVAYLWWRYGL